MAVTPLRGTVRLAFHGTARTGLTLTVVVTSLLAVQAWIVAPKAWQPAGLTATAILAPLSALLAVIMLPALVRFALKPKRALHDALLVVACSGALLAVAAGREDLTLATGAAALLTLAARPLWPELTDGRASRQGWALLGSAGLVVMALFLVEWPSALFVGLGGIVLVVALAAAGWGFWLLTKNAPLPLHPDAGPLAETYAAHAQAGVTPFTLMRDKQYFWSRDHRAYLAFACRTDVAVVLGPAVGPAASVEQLTHEFRSACRRRGWRIAYYQVSEDVATKLGGARKLLGSEALIDLNALTLEGSAMAKLRHEVSRAKRNQISITLLPFEQVSGDARAAMRALATTWNQGHNLGEMAFSVGRQDDRPSAPTVVGLAHDPAGRLVAYCTWLRLPAARALVLDEIRRLPDAPAGAMDLLLYSCLDQMRTQATWASLGLAPLAGAEHADRLARLEAALLQRLGISAASASLFAFKGKYQPRWEPRYLVVERTADWPAAALATFLVHYPAWDQRIVRRVPSRLRLAQGQAAAAVSFALLLVGLTGVVAAAAFSRQGHPFYAVHTAVHAQTGLLSATDPVVRPTHIHRAVLDTLKPPAHRHEVRIPVRAPHPAHKRSTVLTRPAFPRLR
jgi:phosphatidylglycerol lysyltransferase